MKFNIGKGSSIHLGCKFTAVTNFSMGINSTINQHCRIDNRGGVSIQNDVSVSPFVSFITADHDMKTSNCEGRQKEILIKSHVFIGSDAMILQGVVMETGSVLGAKSLLTKSTVTYGIYNGIPARFRNERLKELNYNASYIRWFH